MLNLTTNQEIVQGDCLEVLRCLRENCVDALVTDPPAGIGFMGKDWDDYRRSHNPNDVERLNTFGRLSRVAPEVGRARDGFIAMLTPIMVEVLRVLKPGGYGLVWALPRTSHWTAAAIEEAGFEIRDRVSHLFGTGFPKSLNLGDGRGTALKPAMEDWWLIRKPLDGTVAANVAKWGTGVLNFDACRIGVTDEDYAKNCSGDRGHADNRKRDLAFGMGCGKASDGGRWPAHLILGHTDFCEIVGVKQVQANGAIGIDTAAAAAAAAAAARTSVVALGDDLRPRGEWQPHGNGDGTETVEEWRCAEGCPVAGIETQAEGASRYFYTTKPSRKEREAGCEALPKKSGAEAVDRKEGSAGLNNPRAGAGRTAKAVANVHPTVKSIELMRYLVRLITPTGGIILDPFAGSGTTLCAAAVEGVNALGIEKEEEYISITNARVTHWRKTIQDGSNIQSQSQIENNQGESQMANLPKEYADQAGKARVAGGGNYIQHGDFIFMIDKWFYQKIQDACIICELFVVEARKKIVYEGQKAVEQEPNQVGSTCSDTANFDGASKLSAPANSRAPVLGLFGFKENDVADSKVSETLSYVCSDAQPARGMLIACSTYPKEIRSNKGNYITGRNYECVSKPGEGVNTPEMVKARLEALAKSPEECVKVALAQLAQVGRGAASTGAPSVPALPGAAPVLPTAPTIPAVPAAPSVPWYVTDGWQPHPGDKRYFFKGSEVKLETELQAKQ